MKYYKIMKYAIHYYVSLYKPPVKLIQTITTGIIVGWRMIITGWHGTNMFGVTSPGLLKWEFHLWNFYGMHGQSQNV